MAEIPILQQRVPAQFAAPDANDMGALEGQAQQQVGQGLADLSSVIGDIQAKQRRRHERQSRLSAHERTRTAFITSMDRFQQEHDITDPDTGTLFNEELTAIMEDELSNHNHSPESQAELRFNLNKLKSDFHIDMLREITAQGHARNKVMIEREHGRFGELVTENPYAISDILGQSRKYIMENFGDDLTPEAEAALLFEKQNELIGLAANTMFVTQDLDGLTYMLNANIDGVPMSEMMGASAYGELRFQAIKLENVLQRQRTAALSKGEDNPLKNLGTARKYVTDMTSRYAAGNLNPDEKRMFINAAKFLYGKHQKLNPSGGGYTYIANEAIPQELKQIMTAKGDYEQLRADYFMLPEEQRSGVPQRQEGQHSMYEMLPLLTGVKSRAEMAAEGFTVVGEFQEADVTQMRKDYTFMMNRINMVAAREATGGTRIAEQFRKELADVTSIGIGMFTSGSAAQAQARSVDKRLEQLQEEAFDIVNNPEIYPQKEIGSAKVLHLQIRNLRSQLGVPDASLVTKSEADEIVKQKPDRRIIDHSEWYSIPVGEGAYVRKPDGKVSWHVREHE